MYINELIKILYEKKLIEAKVAKELYDLGWGSEYYFSDYNINNLSEKHIEIEIEKIPGIKHIRTIKVHYHSILYPLNQDENGSDLETIKIPEDIIFLGDIDYFEIKNIRVYRELGQVKIGL